MAGSALDIASGPGHAGPVQWQTLTLHLAPAGEDGHGQWRMEATGLTVAGREGDLAVVCRRGGMRASRPWCAQGEVNWTDHAGDTVVRGELVDASPRGGIGIRMAEGAVHASLVWPSDQQALAVRVEFDGARLSQLPPGVLGYLGLSEMQGRADGTLTWTGDRGRIDLELRGGAFDRPDGRVAAAGLDLDLVADLSLRDGGIGIRLELEQSGGELLAGPLYLPSPESPLMLDAQGELVPGAYFDVSRLALSDPGLRLEGAFRAVDDGGWSLRTLDIGHLEMTFPGAWSRWLDGVLAGYGLAGLETEGTVRGALAWRDGMLDSMSARLESVSLDDPKERFRIEEAGGDLRWQEGRFRAELGWRRLGLLELPFGASAVTATGTENDFHLAEPLVLPLIDGAVVVERLDVDLADDAPTEVTLDARIEPLELAALTRILGFPEFGGELSGRFPGVIYADGRLAFTGGIDIRAFSGSIRLSDLEIERPFGTLPALAAQVEFERLNLAEVTGAFNFGHMGGEVSGWMRNLRLLDWRPVAMDARVFTHEDASNRRISQRAVNNLSTLGGVGSALLSATIMQVFDEFPYRRAGLACRLSNNICHVDGVAPHESGGYYIVEGRALPRLNIIGHRRLVDWPRVVAQLTAIMEQ